MKNVLLILLLVMLLPAPTPAAVTGKTCEPFYYMLEQVPHESIFQRQGFFTSRYFDAGASGCFLVMVTGQTRLGEQSLPDLSGAPGTALYNAGWRPNDKYAANGPGTSVVGLERGSALCLVLTEQPAHLDDGGRIVQSSAIRVRVECLEGAQSDAPEMILHEANE